MSANDIKPMRADGMFTGVQDYYARYRPPIVPEVVTTILGLCPADVRVGDLLDLGTGTGQVVQAFAPFFRTIYAVELDADMLNRARADWAAADPKPRPEVIWELSDVANYVAPASAKLSLITACRSFHWMDQAAILNRYSTQSGDRASFSVFGDSSFWESAEPWAVATRKCVQSFLGEKRRARSTTFSHHRRPYAEIVAESPFSNVSEAAVTVARKWSPREVIGYLYSTTFASRDLFGGALSEFEKSVHQTLGEFTDAHGLLYEQATFNIVVGTKP
ncbi:class I SAM-dependent methyltransferase [Bradyrhizobium yuanmingense]|uniref:class I SAM-dependent methyltransferase n=1 Tax=Bradyrhizobium yuanmingense TaxID=108015 RepID=UPI0034E04CE1